MSSTDSRNDGWKKYLDARDIMVCELICNSEQPIGFNYIKRETGLHQEILSRILKRLSFGGDIEKTETKYRRCSDTGQ